MSNFPKVEEGMVWQYQVIQRGDNPTHQWSLKNKHGGIHISCSVSEFEGRKEWIGGIECHWPKDAKNFPEYYNKEQPHHEHCWLLGEPCWHDGSSLYFSENIAQYLPDPYFGDCHNMGGIHNLIQTDLANWFRSQIEGGDQ